MALPYCPGVDFARQIKYNNGMNQNTKAPLMNMLADYAEKNTFRGHMPGHKGRSLFDAFAFDITELSFSDDLFNPQAAILEEEKLLAAAAGARHTKMLTGGASLGIACILAPFAGKPVILSRASHRSVLDACVLFGITPYFIEDELPCTAQPSPAQYMKAVSRRADAAALFVTTPDYFGRCLPLADIARQAKKAGMALLADEAHGAHLPYFAGMLPESAGLHADAWVQSVHKTQYGLSQAALMHFNSTELFQQALALYPMLATSSPSYPIMASIAESRRLFAGLNKQKFLAQVSALCQSLAQGDCPPVQYENADVTRLVLDVSAAGGGAVAAKHLERAGFFAEMAYGRLLVFILTPAQTDFAPFIKAVATLPKAPLYIEKTMTWRPERLVPLREAAFAQKEWVPLSEAAGRISGVFAGPYPPGYPAVTPGERITGPCVRALRGGAFGLQNRKIGVLHIP